MEDDGILKEFLVESYEGLGRLDQEFVLLEKETGNRALIASIFRTIHTIKGTCGFLGLPKLESVAHGGEDVLSMMRDGKMPVTPEGVTILLEAVDTIKEILSHIESKGSEPAQDYNSILQKLKTLISNESGSQETSASSVEPSGVRRKEKGILDAESSKQRADASVEGKAPKALPLEGATQAPANESGSQETSASSVEPSGVRSQEESKAVMSQNRGLVSAESSIRVDVGLLDKLMNLVGELVLARNQLLQRVREEDNAVYAGTAQRMNLITTELQDAVMKTRMQPILNVWEKFPRLVRDLAKTNGKEVELVMDGAETELDKTLLEAIKDPLTHIVRNSVDHGIETPDMRRARGKGPKGMLNLKAYHEGGQINIEIGDDGNGIDIEKVKRKAIEKGLVSAEAVSRMSEREALNLIFLPGLSTAEKVTNVSGRGVGMDVVRTNIEKIGGTVEMTSRLGQGTSLRIKIPLTLAIIPALMVAAGKELFAIPQASLLELVRVDPESGGRIEVIHDASFYRLRGTLLPILYLNRLLCLEEGRGTLQCAPTETSNTSIVVLKAGERPFGLVVDAVNNSEEIVVKPLSRQLKGLSVFAGATIMGDGRVALILDVQGVAKEGGFLQSKAGETKLTLEDSTEDGSGIEHHTLILFSASGNDRFAVPLALVDRLEEFYLNRVEQAAGRDIIQYRGGLLPLIRLDRILGIDSPDQNREMLPTIVFSGKKKNVGLVVDRILDIVEAESVLHPPPPGKTGVAGSLVIEGMTTDLLNIDQVIEGVEPGWMEEARV
ncbi:MAG: chemotaxis protein CheA [Nitrospirae bacterium]|nr:chemotaxis protein CheA [Nitrospirota bacterium]